ncbi:hypothetical protein [Burkholderia ubonensis]|uniref:hypothetical protein n=1 Tax=Burkholderia ubonensis TaxID=101571 RepID=UPI0018DFC17C
MNQSPASSPRRPLNEWLDGARDTIPMMVGAAPFGVIFGTLVAGGPLAGWLSSRIWRSNS